MNKDVLYIEPEDDITDIITKIEKSKEKIVALVPPKKAGVFRSVVNIKLIHKAGKAAEKTIVLVTTDPSIVKLAAATKLPVTKDLQTAPIIPKEEVEEVATTASEELVEESDGTVETMEDVEELEGGDKKEADEEDTDDEDDGSADEKSEKEDKERSEKEEEKEAKGSKEKTAKKREGKKSTNKFLAWFEDHKKLAIGCGIGIIILIIVLIWALVIAPAATVTVSIQTTSNNFSEAVTFTTTLSEEDASKGKFYLEEKKVEATEKVEFEATGKKNVGEKASGKVIVYAYFPLNIKASTQIAEGETFTISGLVYKATESVVLSYSGEGKTECANKDNSAGLVDYGCRINGVVPVVASEAGSQYNIAASSTGWDTNARVFAYSEAAMSGGTDKEITIVQQSDIDKAKESLTGANLEENKAKLMEQLGDNVMVIDASLNQTTSEADATPKVGEEVKEGEKPTLKATTVTSVFVIDETKVKEFITEKANLADDQKIYEMKNPFIENFVKTDNGYTGKLKTSYMTGPKITETSIVETVKGKGIGDAVHTLKDISGVVDAKISPSFPWVTAVPNDSNRITVYMEVKDQSGNKVEVKDDDSDKSADEKSEENSVN